MSEVKCRTSGYKGPLQMITECISTMLHISNNNIKLCSTWMSNSWMIPWDRQLMCIYLPAMISSTNMHIIPLSSQSINVDNADTPPDSNLSRVKAVPKVKQSCLSLHWVPFSYVLVYLPMAYTVQLHFCIKFQFLKVIEIKFREFVLILS